MNDEKFEDAVSVLADDPEAIIIRSYVDKLKRVVQLLWAASAYIDTHANPVAVTLLQNASDIEDD